MKRILYACFAGALFSSSALAQGSDACGSAQAISGTGFFNYDNTVATQDGLGNALCYEFGTSQIDNDVWFAWTPTASGAYQISTCNVATNDTKIAIYDGANCATSSMIDCNDDTCGLQSQVQANSLTSGTPYLIRIGSFPGGSTGAGQFQIVPIVTPANDDCANATPIAGNGFFNFDNTFASTDGAPNSLCYKFGSSQVEADVWYEWTCPANDSYHVTTCGVSGGVDTRLAIYDGPNCLTANMLDCNDDAIGGACGLESEVFASNLVAGNSYLIRVGTFPGAAGGVGQFEIGPAVPPMPPPNDMCANAEVISGCGSFAYDTVLASTDGLTDPSCYKFGTSQVNDDVWYSWTAPNTGFFVASTCNGASNDTKMAVYADAGACPPVGALDCNDDTCGLQSQVTWNATGGSSYLIRVGSFAAGGGGTGFFDITGCTPGVGTNYCISTTNSTGSAATMAGTGSTSISTNALTLTASNVPDVPGIGIFIAGPSAAQLPFYDGFLCVGQVGLQRINQITTPVGGVVTQLIDFTGASTGTAPLNVTAGSSYFYQHWMRDPAAGGTGANFTDGYDILHTP